MNIKYILVACLVISLAIVQARPAYAKDSDISISSITCWHDGSAFSRDDVYSLWNPTGNVENVKGSPLQLSWSSTNNISELRCRYNLERVTPWTALEVVPSSTANLSSVIVTTQNGNQQIVNAPIPLTAARSVRVNSNQVLGATALDIRFSVPCTPTVCTITTVTCPLTKAFVLPGTPPCVPGPKTTCTPGTCSISLAEVIPFPEPIDVSAIATPDPEANLASSSDYIDVIFPNEDFAVQGSVSSRYTVCSGERNVCLWYSHEDCKRHNHGATAKCHYHCPGVGAYQGNAQFTSSTDFSNGECEEKGWGAPVRKALAVVVSVVMTYVSLATESPMIYAAIVGATNAFAAWNPAYPISQQWRGLFTVALTRAILAYAQASAMTEVDVKFQQNMVDSVVGLVTNVPLTGPWLTSFADVMYFAARYSLQDWMQKRVVAPMVSKLLEAWDVKNEITIALINGVAGAITKPIITSAVGTFGYAYSNLMGNVFNIELSSSLSQLSQISLGEFLRMNLQVAIVNVIESGLDAAIMKAASIPLTNLCISSFEGKSNFDMSGVCGQIGNTMSRWLLEGNKTAIFKLFGVNTTNNTWTALNLQYVDKALNVSGKLGFLTTEVDVAAKINTTKFEALGSPTLASMRRTVYNEMLSQATKDLDGPPTQEWLSNWEEDNMAAIDAEALNLNAQFVRNYANALPQLTDNERNELAAVVNREVFEGESNYAAVFTEFRTQAFEDVKARNYDRWYEQFYDEGKSNGLEDANAAHYAVDMTLTKVSDTVENDFRFKSRVQTLNDLQTWYISARSVNDIWTEAGAMAKAYQQIQGDINFMGDIQEYQDQAIELQSSYVASEMCACYGALRSYPQYQLTPIPCSSTGVTTTPAGYRLTMIDPGSFGPPDNIVSGLPEQGLGWCEAKVSEMPESAAISGGSAIAIINGTSFATSIENGKFGVLVKAPNQTGKYNVTAVASKTISTDMLDDMRDTLGELNAVANAPLALLRIADDVDKFENSMPSQSPAMAAVKTKLTNLKNLLTVISNRPITLGALASKFAEQRAILTAFVSAATTTKLRAMTARQTTTLTELINSANAAASSLDAFTAHPTLARAIAADNATSQWFISTLNRKTLPEQMTDLIAAVRDQITAVRTEPVPISWRTYNLVSQIRIFQPPIETWELADEHSATSSVSALSTIIAIPWSSRTYTATMSTGMFGGARWTLSTSSGTYSANLTELAGMFTPAIDATNTLASETQIAVETATSTQSWLNAIASVKQLKQSFASKIDKIKPVLDAMAGTENAETEILTLGYITKCNVYQDITVRTGWRTNTTRTLIRTVQPYGQNGQIVCPACPSGYVCLSTSLSVSVDRAALARATTALQIMEWIYRVLNQSEAAATDAVWSVKLRASGDIERGLNSVTELQSLLMQSAGLAINTAEIGTAVNGTGLTALINSLSGSVAEGRAVFGIEVIRPDIKVSTNSTKCGAGEPLKYNVSMRIDAAWPRISVTANWWTPFSVPYVPLTNVTIKDIAPNCTVQTLAWWNYGGQSATKITSNLNSVLLVPGRGYYVKTTNNCEIRFEASKFKADGRINLSAAGNAVGTNRALVGSAGRTIPFDTRSLAHKLFDTGLYGGYELNRNCSQLAYEVYDTFTISKPPGTSLLEAKPTQSDPFTNPPQGNLVDMVRPGKSYWIWSNSNCLLSTQTLPGDMQVIKPISFNMTFGMPSEWSSEIVSDFMFDGGIHNLCVALDDPMMCAAVGSPTIVREIKVTPAETGAFGEHQIQIIVSNETYGTSSNTSVRYSLQSFVPDVAPSVVRTPTRTDYSLNITNTASDFCQARTHYLRVEGPLGWNITQTAHNFDLLPNDIVQANVTISPKPSDAQAGWFIAVASADAPELTKARITGVYDVCLPSQTARDMTSNGTNIIYSADGGIRSFDTHACNETLLVSGWYAYGIAYSDGKIFWIDSNVNKIKSYDIAANQSSDVVNVSGADDVFYVAADSQAVYWVDNRTIKRVSLVDNSITTLATDLDSPAGLDVDAQYVYWAEPTRIRKVATTGVCSGSNCTIIADISEPMLGPAPGRLQDVAIDGDTIFAVVSNVQLYSNKDYSKILRIDSTGVEIVTKLDTLDWFGFAEPSGIAVDNSYVYWSAGNIDRISKWTKTTVVNDFLNVLGHNPAIVNVQPEMLQSIAGVPVRFNVTVTNNNSADAPEPSNRFWIKDIQLPTEMELCRSEFECESANGFSMAYSRQELLDAYTYDYRNVIRSENKTFTLWLRSRGSVSEGTVLAFNVTVGSIDPAMDGHASGAINITAPREPGVSVVPQEPWSCMSELMIFEPGFISQNCSAKYNIQITNPEQLDANYAINVITPAQWSIGLEQEIISVPGMLSYSTGWNQRIIAMNVTSTETLAPLGKWHFVVNVTNIDFPERWINASFDLIVTPDNMNGLCEPELGETKENTPDCSSSFTCGFNGSCQNTTDWGVDWSANAPEPIELFGVCEFKSNKLKNQQASECLEEFDKPQAEREHLICTANTGFCHANCAERSGKYFLVAKTAVANYTSPTFHYVCPACIGKFFSPTVRNDVALHRWRPELEDGIMNFSDWITIAEGEFLYATASPSGDCVRVTQAIVDRAGEMNHAANGVLANLNYPIDGQCAATRLAISDFINTSERMFAGVCRNAGTAILNITRLNIPVNVTLGIPTNATVEIENPSATAYAQGRCTFTQSRFGAVNKQQTSNSDCKLIESGQRLNFSMPITLELGNWNASCDAVWSTFSDCEVVVGVYNKHANFTVIPPNTSLTIVPGSVDIPNSGVQGQKVMIRMIVRNDGEGANASVECALHHETIAQYNVESNISFVGFNQSTTFRIEFRPEVTGDWVLDSCTVYKIGSKIFQQNIIVNEPLLIFPVCTAECQNHGFDFGGCFSNATPTVGALGEYDCSATERCTCGTLNILEQSCERTGSVGTLGRYNATIHGTWQTGNYLRIDGTLFQNGSFDWSRQLTQSGAYTANITIYKGISAIHMKSVELECVAMPIINLTLPESTVVNKSVTIRPNVVDANATLDIDNLPYGTLPPFGYVWDTTTISDGWHFIRIVACNAAGCTTETRNVRVQNEIVLPRYDFTIDPGFFQTNVRSGETASLTFIIRNTGTARDTYTLTDDMNVAWSRIVSMNGVRFVRTITLDAGQQAEFTISVSAPSSTLLGQNASLSVRATSTIGGAIRTSGPHVIRIAEVPNSAPDLLSIWHNSMAVHLGETLIFNIQIMDRNGDAITSVRVCRDPACAATWCIATPSFAADIFSCSIIAPLAGNYSYWIVAQDASGLTTISSERMFYVSILPPSISGNASIAKNAIAAASSSLADKGAGNAVDGDASTYWVSQTPLPQWLQIDLRQARWINGIGIYSPSSARPKFFDVLIGDCTNFNTVYTASSARYVDNWYRVGFDSIFGRCVRLNVRESEDGSPYVAISEFEVYEGRPSIPADAPVTCGNSLCDAGETVGNCPTDCATAAPSDSAPIIVYVIIAVIVIAVVILLFWPRIELWLSYIRG